MKKLCLVLFSMTFVGCGSIPQSKSKSEVTSLTIVDETKPYQNILRDLTRASRDGIAVQIIGYYAEAFPFTRPLLEAKNRELCAKNMDPKPECEKRLQSELASLVIKESCLQVELMVAEIDWAKPQVWKFKFSQAQKSNIEGKASSFSIVPRVNLAASGTPYSNSGLVCFKEKIDFAKDFSLSIIPQFGGAAAKPLSLAWEVKGLGSK